MGIVENLAFDHLTVFMTHQDIDILESHLSDLRPLFQVCQRDETSAASGVWSYLYLGCSHSYVELVPLDPDTTPVPYTVSLRTTSAGMLADMATQLRNGGVDVIRGTERLVDGAESMEWFHNIELPSDVQLPVFLMEYATDWLSDVGLSPDSMGELDSIGGADASGCVVGVECPMARESFARLCSVFQLLSSSHSGIGADGQLEVGRGEPLMVRRAERVGHPHVRFSVSSECEFAYHTPGGWSIQGSGKSVALFNRHTHSLD